MVPIEFQVRRNRIIAGCAKDVHHDTGHHIPVQGSRQAFVTLVEARRGLSEQAAAALDAKLVLILANHIGDIDVLREAIALAKADGR